MKVSVCLTVCFLSLINAKKTYDGYQLLTVRATDHQALEVLHDLSMRSDLQVDFWSTPRSTQRNVSVAVHRNSLPPFKRELQRVGLEPIVTVKNLRDLLDKEDEALRSARASLSSEFSLNEYHTLEEINAYLDSLSSSCSRCEILTVGQSFEGRDLRVVKISGGSLTPVDVRGPSNRKAVWVDAGIHAREWISPATALKIIQKLVNLGSAGEDTIRLMDDYDWYILPVFNPDGYVYTWTNDRFWRKTRSTGHSATCVGVDGNRNWNFHWMEGGASGNPCSEIYAGPSAFSESEVKSVSRFLRKRGDRFLVYMTLHAFSQMIFTPWSYTTDLPEDFDELETVADAAAQAIREETGKEYIVGSPSNILYVASGSSFDWTKGVAGIKYSFGAELRDQGEYGFVLPASQIRDQGREAWSALKAMMEVIHSYSNATPEL